MKISEVYNTSFSTVIVTDNKLPEKLLGNLVVIDNRKYKVTGVPTNDNYSFMIDHLDKTDGKQISSDDVYVVWLTKVLQSNKALLSTTLFDGMYYELTYNGDKNELYIDVYKRFENKELTLDD